MKIRTIYFMTYVCKMKGECLPVFELVTVHDGYL